MHATGREEHCTTANSRPVGRSVLYGPFVFLGTRGALPERDKTVLVERALALVAF